MKVLIIGGAGLVGRELQQVCQDRGDVILAPTSKELNLLFPAWINEYVFGHRPDLVINAAVVSDVDGCEADAREALEINTFGAEALAHISARHGCKFVHISSDYVFSGADRSYYSEDNKTSPISMYGLTKEEAEKRIEFIRKHYNSQSLIVRSSWIYGRYRDTFIEYFIKKLVETPINQKVPLVSDQMSTPTLAKDLARAIFKFVDANLRGIVHFANQPAASKMEIMCEVVAHLNKVYLGGNDERFRSNRFDPMSMADIKTWKARRPQYSPLKCSILETQLKEQPRKWQDCVREHIDDVYREKIEPLIGAKDGSSTQSNG